MTENYSEESTAAEPTATTLYDREMEEAVIGAVMINPDVYIDLASIIRPEDFYLNRHQWIWQAFTDLFQENQSFDFLTIRQKLDSKGHLEDVGGVEYLISLSNAVPSSLHAESYARNLSALAARRRLLNAANDIARLSYRMDYNVETVLGESEKAVFSVSQDRYARDIVPLKQVVKDYLTRLGEVADSPDGIKGLNTGLASLDKLLEGLQKSDFLIVAGRPGMGKSGFLIGIAKHVGLNLKRSVAMFTLEMSAEQLLQRMVAQETEIDSQKLRSGKLNDDEMDLAVHSLTILNDARIYIDDTPAITPLQIRSKCRRLQMEEGLDLVIVDYLQLMASDVRTENRVQEVSYISRYLKVLARELNVPVLAAAQLSRAVEQRTDKQPVLSDLRESGSLEQDADIVMFISRPEQMNEKSPNHNVAKLAVAKHRNGPTHSGLDLIFIEKLAMFRDAYKGPPQG
ncbi:MAG: replicative DNA helicase [Anaerolineaceae bacterium]|nr:replicative DNA helicase [Anaerolineaceae bacterium]